MGGRPPAGRTAALAARLLNAACAVLALGLVFLLAFAAGHRHGPRRRLALAAAAVVLLMTNPLFRYTTGQAWNHDAPNLLLLAAFALQLAGIARPGGALWGIGAGVLVGVAAGMRLTYILAAVPPALLVAFDRGVGARPVRYRWLLGFGAGVVVALSPALLLAAVAPREFVFGNFDYARLNTLYRQWEEPGLPARLQYVKDLLREPGNLALAAAFAVLVPWRRLARGGPGGAGLALELAVLTSGVLLVGGLLPAPAWPQYFFAPVPFVVLACVYGLAARAAREVALGPSVRVFLVMAVAAAMYGYKDYRSLSLLFAYERWVPARVHAVGQDVGRLAGAGPVLTLTPIYPLEGGARIYRAFVTGPFAWRTAHLVPAADRSRLGIVSPAELPGLLERDPPGGVFVGLEPGVEDGLVAWARERGFRALALGAGTLWIPPEHRGRPQGDVSRGAR